MFCSNKTGEAGSGNFVSDGEQNIPDHGFKLDHNIAGVVKVCYLFDQRRDGR